MTIQARKKEAALNFTGNMCPISAYVLGFLWADGYVQKNRRKYDYNIKVSIQICDAEEIFPVLCKTGDWKYYCSTNKITNRTYACLRYSNKYLYQFLCDNDFLIKSQVSPVKILNIIPNDLKHYWWRGYFDGDGYLSANPKTGAHCVDIASNYNQDWKFCEELCGKLNIEFHSKTHKDNTHANSHFYLVGKKNVYKFLHFIYKDRDLDNIGLSRKFDKFKSAVCFYTEQEKQGIGIENYKNKKFIIRKIGSFDCLYQAIDARRKFIWEFKKDEWNKYYPHLSGYSKFSKL
jgi:hypothetical protein